MKKIGIAAAAFIGVLLFSRFFPKKNEAKAKAEGALKI
jgi:hypothetical protein